MAEARQAGVRPRIGLVATDEVRVSGLRAVLSDIGGMEVVLMSEPGALEKAGLEVVLVDASSTEHLLELLTSFRRLRPRIRLLVIGGTNDVEFIEQVIAVGARGVLTHDATEAELRMAIEVVSDGSVWAPRKVLSRLLDRANHPATRSVRLTRREVEVLRLLLQGFSNREIAQELKVEPATVKAHLGRLMRKAGVTNRTGLGVHAAGEKWV